MRTNCLLSDFSFMDSKTLSRLFNTYCTNIYGSPLWKDFYRKLLSRTILYCLEKMYQKSLENSFYFTYCFTTILCIHNTIAFNVILEKGCITFQYNIVFTDWFENINVLYNKIDIYVEHNFDAESF